VIAERGRDYYYSTDAMTEAGDDCRGAVATSLKTIGYCIRGYWLVG